MRTEELKRLINEYLDGELEKGKEALLFTELSLNEEAREYFKSSNMINAATKETIENFPDSLEERILFSLTEEDEKQTSFFIGRGMPAFISYSFAALLLIVSLFFYTETTEYKEVLNTKVQQINTQKEWIQLLENSLPAAEVKATIDKEVVIESRI